MFQRQTTGAIVCPDCGSLVDVRADRCPRCGRSNPGLWGFGPWLGRLDIGVAELVLGACAVMFVLSLLSDPAEIFGGGLFGILSPSPRSLFLYGASGAVPVIGYGRWWTVLSAAWLHGGLLHIAMNMMWLRDLMPVTQRMYGIGRLLIIYTVSAASGFALTSLMALLPLGPFRGAGFTVGASAPLFGLFGALIVYGNRSGNRALGQQVWRWVLIFAVIGFIIPVIDNWAHLGGFVGGYATARYLDPLTDEKPGHVLAGIACIAANVLAVLLSVLQGVSMFR